MNILTNIAIAVVSSAVMFIAGVNLPASNFSLSKFTEPILGVFTEISTATNLADFPTTYNANLNKTIEVGTTSVASITTLANLATVGTLTSGALSTGFTVVPVSLGGTGTTSPSTYSVLLGNGSLGITIASSTGTTGQFLTSNGPGAYPSFQSASVNQTLDYNFTSSFFGVKNLNASSTVANPMTLNGLAYSLNSVRQASSTVLMEDGSGNLSFNSTYNKKFYLNTSTTGITASQASSTIFSVSVPANTLGTSNAISCKYSSTIGSTVNTAKLKLDVSYGGTASSSVMTGAMGAGSGNLYVNDVSFLLSASGATNTQKLTLYEPSVYDDATRQQFGVKDSTPNVDSTAAQTLYFVAAFATANGSIPAGHVICTLIR